MRKRTKAREAALKVLYQSEITRWKIKMAFENFWNDFESEDKNVKDFSRRLTSGIEEYIETIDEKISQYATNWQLKRMAIIDRNVLRIGVFELLHADDIPPKVTINECIELAKKYGDVESSKFVNGILDKIHKSEIISQPKPSQ